MLLKKRYVKDMINKEVEQALTLKNVTRENVIDMLLECYKKAEKKDDVTNMRQVAENFVDLLQMKQKDEETKWSDTAGFIDNVDKAIEVEEHSEEKAITDGTQSNPSVDSKTEGAQGET